jgi:hypothetical protein
MMDVHEVAALLHIEEKTREHPTLKAIHDAAMRKLQEHNNTHVEAAEPEALPPTAPQAALAAEDSGDNGNGIRRV